MSPKATTHHGAFRRLLCHFLAQPVTMALDKLGFQYRGLWRTPALVHDTSSANWSTFEKEIRVVSPKLLVAPGTVGSVWAAGFGCKDVLAQPEVVLGWMSIPAWAKLTGLQALCAISRAWGDPLSLMGQLLARLGTSRCGIRQTVVNLRIFGGKLWFWNSYPHCDFIMACRVGSAGMLAGVNDAVMLDWGFLRFSGLLAGVEVGNTLRGIFLGWNCQD